MKFDDFVPELLNTEQVAKILRLKSHTVAVGRSDGSLNIPYIKINRSVRYRKEEVEAYIRSKQIGKSLLGE